MVSKTKPGYFKKIRVRMTWLRKALHKHSHAYYVLHDPKISDQEFDTLMAELRILEETHKDRIPIPPDTITKQVGMTPTGAKVKHTIRMLSLEKCTTKDELFDFCSSIADGATSSDFCGTGRAPWIVEPKLDGISLTLIYKSGKLVSAATRGDGETGENVLANARYIVPQILSDCEESETVEIRGEVLISKLQFARLQEVQASAGLKAYKNSRNAAAGIMSRIDTSPKILSHLEFVAYQMFVNGAPPRYHQYALMYMRKAGLKINDSFQCHSSSEVYDAVARINKKRQAYRYDVDGAVIKVNSAVVQRQLGEKTNAPAWAIAFKFPADQAVTELRAVEWQTGRTGQVTPVAILAPVNVHGVTVTRCTLHNADYIAQLGLHLGDEVELIRAGDVIPKIVRVVKSNVRKDKIKIPRRCPSCNERLYKSTDEAASYCPSDTCSAKAVAALEHFCSRQAMNIKGLGSELCRRLVEEGVVEHIADLYRVAWADLKIFIRIVGSANSGKVLQQIEDSKKQPLWRLLVGLGIDTIGVTKAKLLAKHFGTLQRLSGECDDYTVDTTPGRVRLKELKKLLGEVSGEAVFDYFLGIRHQDIVADFIHFEVSCRAEDSLRKSRNKGELADQTYVITGVLKTFTRAILTEKLEEEGATVSNSVTKNTTALIAGDKPGSKLAKAIKLGVPVLNEQAILVKLK